jgi:actin-like ATPase involved in cell morphogenesis
VPSVLFMRADGEVVTGEAANRCGIAEADRVVREFTRRIGDPTPLMVGGVGYPPETLASRLLRWVVDVVSGREGEPPAQIAVTHPIDWGPYKRDLLRQAMQSAGLGYVEMLTEPEAAAISSLRGGRVEVGGTIAVYDLGGGTCDAAVLRRTPSGFAVLGAPERIERLGGVDLDEIVFQHVARALGGELDRLDPADPGTLAAVARLRQECVEAKEALSHDTEVSIPVLLPDLRTQVRLVRGEFETMIRPVLAETTAALHRTVRSAQLDCADLDAVLLVGGSSRIPLVAQMVSEVIGRPVRVDADPEHAIALGAALATVTDLRTGPTVPVDTTVPPAPLVGAPPAEPVPAFRVETPLRTGSLPPPPRPAPVDWTLLPPGQEPRVKSSTRVMVLACAVVVAFVLLCTGLGLAQRLRPTEPAVALAAVPPSEVSSDLPTDPPATPTQAVLPARTARSQRNVIPPRPRSRRVIPSPPPPPPPPSPPSPPSPAPTTAPSCLAETCTAGAGV